MAKKDNETVMLIVVGGLKRDGVRYNNGDQITVDAVGAKELIDAGYAKKLSTGEGEEAPKKEAANEDDGSDAMGADDQSGKENAENKRKDEDNAPGSQAGAVGAAKARKEKDA